VWLVLVLTCGFLLSLTGSASSGALGTGVRGNGGDLGTVATVLQRLERDKMNVSVGQDECQWK